MATDLACEAAPFDSRLYWDASTVQSATTFPGEARHGTSFQVHGGMFEIAVEMGQPSSILTSAVAKALELNPGYRALTLSLWIHHSLVDPPRCAQDSFSWGTPSARGWRRSWESFGRILTRA